MTDVISPAVLAELQADHGDHATLPRGMRCQVCALLSLVASLTQERDTLREALAATTAMCRSATTWPADDVQGLRYHALEQAKTGMAALAKKDGING